MFRRLPALSPAWPVAPARWPFFYGWTVLGLSALGMVASIPGQTMGVSVFTDPLLMALGLERAQLSLAYLLGTAAGAFFLPWGGRWFDRVGARRFVALVCLAFGVALVGMSQLDRLSRLVGGDEQPLVALLVAGLGFFLIRFLGQGLVTLGSRSMLAKWWNRRRGLVTAISGVVVAASFAVAPRVLAWQIDGLGWRGAFLFNAALVGLGMSLVALLFFRDNPEECGLEMDGPLAQSAATPRNPDTLLKRDFTRGEALRTFAFWSIALALGMQGYFSTGYTFHVLDVARKNGVAADAMLNFFIWAAVLSVAANLSVGFLLDYIRLRWVVLTINLGGILFAGGILALPSFAGGLMLVLGMGLAGGCFPALSGIAFARYFGRRELGAIQGAATAVMVAGSAVGPLLFSLSLEGLGSYRPIISLTLGVFLLLATVSLATHNPQRHVADDQAES